MKLKGKLISVAIAIITVMVTVFGYIAQQERIKLANMDAGERKALTYGQLQESDYQTESENVKFSAFFTRDLDNDGYAERIKGIAKQIGTTDETLWAEIEVSKEGYLRNGKITINGQNFDWTTSIVEDTVVSGNYIGLTRSINLQNEVNSGSQKLFEGKISSKIGNNVNDYSKVSTVTLTGTYVNNNGEETPINVSREVTVDWYGDVNAEVFSTNQPSNITYKEDGMYVNFTISSRDTKRQLILKETLVTAQAPQLKNYYPDKVSVVGLSESEFDYNPETGLVSIKRETTKNEQGKVTPTLKSPVIYNVTFRYPKSAIPENTSDNQDRSFDIQIPVTAKFTAYNNQNEEFENIVDDEANGIIVFTGSKQGNGTVVNEAGVTIGTLSKNSYKVSKEKAVQAYNGLETEDDLYEVKWHSLTELVTDKEILKENKPDEFIKNDGTKIELSDLVSYKGIYFSVSGGVSRVEVYNADTDELIKTFSSSDSVFRYSKVNPYYYKEPVKNIRVEAYGITRNSNFNVYHIKEINDDKLVENITKEDFDKVSGIYTYLWAQRNEEQSSTSTFTGFAQYKELESEVILSINPKILETKNLTNVQTLKISTTANDFNQLEWKNGEFLIRFPKNVIYAEKNSINITNNSVDIVAYDIYKEGDYYFAKIITSNDERTTYEISLSANIVLNPLSPSTYDDYTLYAYNEDCNTYLTNTKDIYDVNSNNNYEELVGLYSVSLGITAPSTLLTSETVSNYNDEGTVTVAPNIAEVRREDRTADINVNVFNNYERTISDIKILGVIPFQGNTYAENANSLGSQFTSIMTNSGIQVPSGLQGKVTIYYTENATANKDLEDESNGWTTTPDSFANVKRFLIDFNTSKLTSGASCVFTYTVQIPEDVDYNKFAFSEHIVYCALETENGKLTTQVEPNKVGIRIVRTYALNIRKLNIENFKPVSGAVYKLTEFDDADNVFSTKLITSNLDGYLSVEKLYVNRKYKLEEIREPASYMLDDSKFEFKVIEDENGELQIQMLSDDTFDTAPVLEDNTLKSTINEQPRYEVVITKKDEQTNEAISNVKFDLSGREYTTNKEGKVTLANLNQDVEYTLKETYADGYYLIDDINFKLIKENGEFVVDSDNQQFKNAIITVSNNEDLIKVEVTLYDERQPSLLINKVDKKTGDPISDVIFTVEGRTGKLYTTDSEGKVLINGFAENTEYTIKEIVADGYYLQDVTFTVVKDNNNQYTVQSDKFKDVLVVDQTRRIINVTLENDPIPTYDLKIKKIEEANESKTLEGAKFQLYSEDKDEIKVYTTNENGIIEIPELYAYVEGKYLSGNYILTEIEAPVGYGNCAEEIRFRVVKNENDEFDIQIRNSENLTTISNSEFENGVFNLTIQDKPLFTLIKTDKETGEPLANASFMIRQLNLPFDFAKDLNGEYVGTLDDEGNYIVTTDENGKITLSLENGKYLLIEVGYPEGYEKEDLIQIFEVITGEKEVTDTYIYEINTIEDLVEFSRQVNLGNSYSHKTVNLNKTLDFNDDNSYTDPNGTTFGDLNGDGNVEGIKAELTNENGKGFTPIGTFSGTFDGNGNEIRNIYINSSNKNVGLFGYCSNATIKNLGVSGIIISTYTSYDTPTLGGIAGTGATIENCYNKANITGTGNSIYVGGITGLSYGTVTKCYNSGKIIGKSYVGGIVGNGYVNYCYNTGDIEGTGNVGGIIGTYSSSGYNIAKCNYNTGNITSAGTTNGRAGTIIGYSGDRITIENSYYLDSVTLIGPTTYNQGTAKTTEELKSDEIIKELNEYVYGKDTDNLNNGYPIFRKNEVQKVENIEYIEDLVEFSKQVNKEVNYEGITVNLVNTIDFNEDSSYRNPEDISYGDLNGDTIIEGIKAELTNTDGKGFTPIGYYENNLYEMHFNGNGNEIRNIYIKSDNSYVGLFGHAKRVKIENLGITGNIISTNPLNDNKSRYVGGIVGYDDEYTIIENCYNKANIEGTGDSVCGIAGTVYNDSIILDCYNTGSVTGNGIGNGAINCYNIGEVTGLQIGNNSNNCYYLDREGIDDEANSPAIAVSSEYMKSDEFIDDINNKAFTKDTENINNGYPILLNTNVKLNTTIESIEDLVRLSNIVSLGYNYENTTVTLERTLDFNEDSSYENPKDKSFGDLNGDGIIDEIKIELTKQGEKGFTPIGNSSNHSFSGIFEGNGNEIKNIYIKSGYSAGLFGYVKNSVIQNITVSGTIEQGDYCGIVGYCQGGSLTLINCHNKMNITASHGASLLGYVDTSSEDKDEILYIDNCSNEGNIQTSSYGGLVGVVYANMKNEAIIKNSYNIGNINSASSNSAGSIVGYLSNGKIEINNCYNKGTVKSNGDNVGGIIGKSHGDLIIINSWNEGNVSGGRYTGGIIGYQGRTIDISNCYNLGDVSGSQYIAGIIGYSSNTSQIKNCYNKGKITRTADTYFYLAGIIGNTGNPTYVDGCYNTGDLINDKSGRSGRIGGIVAYGQGSSVINSYNTGNIINNTTSTPVGGIIGENGNATNCYNTGNITSQSSGNIGGIIGYGQGTAKNCYNTGDISVKGSDYCYVGGIVGSSGNDSENCYNTGDISVEGATVYVGGITSYKTPSGSCYNTGNINAKSIGYAYVGGICAYGYGGATSASNFYNTGNINVVSTSTSSSASVGGLIGNSAPNISNGYNTGDIMVEYSYDASVGGLVGYTDRNKTISNCVNTGDIYTIKKGNNAAQLFVGGLCGNCNSSCSIVDSANTGNIKVDSEDYTQGSYIFVGGLGGSNYSANNSYNKGNLDINLVGGSQATSSTSTYIGGLVGYGGTTDSINYGNIKFNCTADRIYTEIGGLAGYGGGNITGGYNIGNLDVTILNPSTNNMNYKYLYVGGIAGGKSYNINSNYNLGNIKVKSKNIGNTRIGRIYGEYSDPSSSDENYYLSTMTIDGSECDNYSVVTYGTETPLDTIEVPERNPDDITDIKSVEFYNQLNTDGVWGHLDGYMPKLFISEANAINSVQIGVENTIKKFNITTDIDESDGVKGGSITGEDANPFETVRYGSSNANEIEMVPDNGYVIENIKINGELYPFEVTELGTYTIEAGDIANVKEDKHIVVKYGLVDQVLQINKVDKDNNSFSLAGAKFSITNGIEDNDVFGKLTFNPVDSSDVGFKYEDGKIVTTSTSHASSYIELDLTNLEGDYNALIDMNTTGAGLFMITPSESTAGTTDTSPYNHAVYISGTTEEKVYSTKILNGGKKYYLQLRLPNGGPSNCLSINSIKLVKNNVEETFNNSSNSIFGNVTNNGTYYFEYNDGKLIPNNNANQSGIANSYIPIDLTQKEGKYAVSIKAQSNNPAMVAAVQEDTTALASAYDSYSDKTFMWVNSGSPNYGVGADYTYVSNVLDGGKMYYLKLASSSRGSSYTASIDSIELLKYTDVETFQNNNGDGVNLTSLVTDENGEINVKVPVVGDYTITELEAPEGYTLDNTPIVYTVKNERENGIIGKANSNATNYFVKQNGKYVPSDYNSTNKSYFEIDLTNMEGKYRIGINAEIANGAGLLWADINNSSDPINYTSPYKNFLFISNTSEARDYYSKGLEGGNKYYLHLGYTGGNPAATVNVNSIDLYKYLSAESGCMKELSPVDGIDGYFEVANGKIKPNNLEGSDPAQSYIEIDLTDKEGIYNVLLNAETNNSGLLFADVTNNTDSITYSQSDDFVYISGTNNADSYVSKDLTGGNKYYLHLAYTGTTSIDDVIINSIELLKRVNKVDEGPINQLTIKNKAKQPVIVHHYLKDQEGNYTTTKVADDEELGVFDIGEKYTTSPKIDLDNLELEKDDNKKYVVPENASGEVGDGGVEVIYYYETKPIELTIQHVLENTGEKLEEDEKLECETRVDIEDDKVKNISTAQIYDVENNNNYKKLTRSYAPTLITQDDETVYTDEIEFSNNSQLVYYYAVTDSSIKVKYVDKDTNEEIAEEETIPGIIGEEYTVEIKDIDGYTYVERDGELTGTYETEEKTIILYYKQAAKVIVKHIARNVEENTESILDTETANGLAGDTYTSSPKNFEHYKLVERPANETVTMTKNVIELKYYYEKIKTEVVEKHVDDVTNDILYQEEHEGEAGDEYEILPREFTRYDLVEDKLPNNSKGTRGDTSIEVVYYYKYKSTVTAKYIDIDKEGNEDEEIADSEEQEIYEGSTYETEAKEIPGYTLVETPVGASGTIGKEDKVLVYKYEKEEVEKDADVVENHIDVKTNEVISMKKYTGKVGDEYTTKSKEIENYDLVEDRLPQNAEGTMTEEEIVVNYYYIYKTTVTTRYVDKETNKDITSKVIQELHEGDTYKTEAKEIKGYTLDETSLPKDSEGTLTKEDKVIIYYYNKEKPASVVENHIDMISNKLLSTKKYSGKVGDEYSTTSKEIAKYDLVTSKLPENAKGTMTEEEIVVNYYYVYKSTVTTRYVDEETGKDLVPSEKQDIHDGDTYTTEPKEIDGYELDEESIPEDAKGTIGKEDKVVTYYYEKQEEKVDPEEAVVIVKHIDVISNKLLDKEKISGKVGDEYSTTEKEIAKYELVTSKLPENAKGTMTEEEIVVNYYYVYKSTVTTRYVDKETGKDIITKETQEIHDGDKYTTEPKEIDGYELIKTAIPENAEGTMTKKAVEVIYYYEKVEEPEKEYKTPEKEEVVTVVKQNNPYTGDAIVKSVMIFMLSIVLLLLIKLLKNDNK